ncbi:hypothetical protein DICPUDRAFT_91241 [Dictyostelium purpureum]|uniref:Carbohydrate binding domain-containing protein n=1 Tax=Dictyostelium purpureum TaxID=5786 RepID=F0Z9M0_DICPU|nr:uncharacterized protein DICPUDRAFT_91241 [Dictyostelium purpureum]EGC39322.1 hypothetical protein DICPUDRAFT_91241 [Dictyostelium purpureum]|eukprot:XP_003284110.1 hypothetical protein DICPUDRAFT_91241 [Dictyostelium purpureum]
MKVLYILLGLLLTFTIANARLGEKSNHNEPARYDPYPNHHPLQCGPESCNYGEVCHIAHDDCICLPHPKPHPHPHKPRPTRDPQPTIVSAAGTVYLTSRLIGRWTDGSRGGKTFSQYDITIHNDGNRNIKEIYISTDSTFKLRDNSDASLWNMVRLNNGILGLPSYQNSINAHATYVFGFILEGVIPANLNILKIIYQ